MEPIPNVSNLKEGFCHISYALWKNDLNGLSFNPQSPKEWVCQDGDKKCSLLMYVSIPTAHVSFNFCVSFSFLSFFFFWFYLFSFFVPSVLLYCSQQPLFILSTMVRFATFTLQLLLAPYGCPSKTTYWPFGWLATTIALNVLIAPLPIPRQNCLSCFLHLSMFHYSHLDKD